MHSPITQDVRATGAIDYAPSVKQVTAAMASGPAHRRWTSNQGNALWVSDRRIAAHALYLALGPTDKARQAAHRALFRSHYDKVAIDNIRLAMNRNQPLCNSRFYARIERASGMWREARVRGRPRLEYKPAMAPLSGQGKLKL